MDRIVLTGKPESLRRCVARLREKCPAAAEDLAADADLQDILALNLTRAVQLAVDIANHVIAARELPAPNTMGQSFDRLIHAGLLT